jgi:hypothetical protein
VATTGDSFGNVLDIEGIGRGVPPENVDALEAALEEMLYDEAAAAVARENVVRYAEQFRWATVLKPLLQFAQSPHRAQDLPFISRASAELTVTPVKPTFAGYVQVFARSLRHGGVTEVARRARGFVRRRMPAAEQPAPHRPDASQEEHP